MWPYYGQLLKHTWLSPDHCYHQKNPRKNEPSMNNSPENPLESLSNELCQSLLSMLQSYLSKAKTNTKSSSNSHIADMCSQTKLIHSMRNDMWILDFEASNHIWHNKSMFSSLQPIQNATISLLNHTHVSIKYTIKISPSLVPKQVMFLLEFCFNLLLISALTSSLPTLVKFCDGCCIIQNKYSLKTIGKANVWHGLYLFQSLNTSETTEFTTLNIACYSHVWPTYYDNDLSVASLTYIDIDTLHNRLATPVTNIFPIWKTYSM